MIKIRRRTAFVEFAARTRYELHRALVIARPGKGDEAAVQAGVWPAWEGLTEIAREVQRGVVEAKLLLGPKRPEEIVMMGDTNLDHLDDALVFQFLDTWRNGPSRRFTVEGMPR